MKYRIESLSHFYGHGEPEKWLLLIEYSDKRNTAAHMSAWAKMFLPHYGLVVDTDTGAIEYEFGATNREWIKDALNRYFESIPIDGKEVTA